MSNDVAQFRSASTRPCPRLSQGIGELLLGELRLAGDPVERDPTPCGQCAILGDDDDDATPEVVLERLGRGDRRMARMPADTRVIVAGTGSAAFRGTIRIARSDIGITEETRVVFAVTDEVARATDDTTRLLERLAGRQQVLLGSAWTMRGAADTTIVAGRELLPQPVAAVVGARGVRALGIGATGPSLPGSRLAGNKRTPSLVIGFGGDATAWQRFADTVVTLGPDEIGAALSPADLIAGGWPINSIWAGPKSSRTTRSKAPARR